MNEEIKRLFHIAHLIMPAFLEAHKDVLGGRTGIYLAIHEQGEPIGKSIEGQIIGVLPSEKIEEKKFYATEKIIRMQGNVDWCSFQSENEEKKQFGGGFCTIDYLVGPSGFPPHLDQKFGLLNFLTADRISMIHIKKILELSKVGVNKSRKNNGEEELGPLSGL